MVFEKSVLLCSLAGLQLYYVDQAGLKLIDPPRRVLLLLVLPGKRILVMWLRLVSTAWALPTLYLARSAFNKQIKDEPNLQTAPTGEQVDLRSNQTPCFPEAKPPLPHTEQSCSGKLTFGFIVPRTLQMVDLVNTCRAQVPHLPRLLPLPKLKSWVAAMIFKDTSTSRFQKD